MLPGTIRLEFEFGVVSSLPVKKRPDGVVLLRDDNLLGNGTQDPLLDVDATSGMIPQPGQIRSQSHELIARGAAE